MARPVPLRCQEPCHDGMSLLQTRYPNVLWALGLEGIESEKGLWGLWRNARVLVK
jgi:hypothetical protein